MSQFAQGKNQCRRKKKGGVTSMGYLLDNRLPLRCEEIVHWLAVADVPKIAELKARAARCRRDGVGDEIHLRALLNISNLCKFRCSYCGLNSGNRDLTRYCMMPDEIRNAAVQADRAGIGTIVLQSGQNGVLSECFISDMIRQIKSDTSMAITLCLGERQLHELKFWKRCGADRYLLKLETLDTNLFERIHPDQSKSLERRIGLLMLMREIGYEIGSGLIVGLPGQTYDSLSADIEATAMFGFDMIANGPYVPHPGTPLGGAVSKGGALLENQVPATDEMASKVIALTRILNPKANIPVTTALETANEANGIELGIESGANIIMIDVTPRPYRRYYDVYPRNRDGDWRQRLVDIRKRIEEIGMKIAHGLGRSPAFLSRMRGASTIQEQDYFYG